MHLTPSPDSKIQTYFSDVYMQQDLRMRAYDGLDPACFLTVISEPGTAIASASPSGLVCVSDGVLCVEVIVF